MVTDDSLMLVYIRKVIEEHTLPLEDNASGLIEAGWLVDLLHKVTEVYNDDSV